MAQEYNEILPNGSTNILQDNIDSRKNDEALRSGFSGSAFPTSPVPVAGQRCYREDLKKEYIFNGENWVEVASSGAIAQEVALARGTHTELQNRLGVSINPDGTLKTPATANVDEFKVSGLEPTYVSTNSFSVPGDMRAIFTENRRLKITQGAETVYPAVVSASYDDVSDKTTIVIDNITITNEIAAIGFSMVQMGLPANLDAATLNGKSDTAFQEVSEKDQPGGYAGLDSDGALNSKTRSTYISDFNTATIGGFYYANPRTLNGPSPISEGYAGTALVIDRLAGNSRVMQIAFGVFAKTVYIRCSANTSHTEWTDWRRLDETTWGSISGTLADQTDLQSALDGKQSVSEKDQPGGYAGLDATGKIPGDLLNIADPVWGSISGTLADQTDLQTALDGKANTSHSHSYAPIPSSSSLPVGVWVIAFNVSSPAVDVANGSTIAGSKLRRMAFDYSSSNVTMTGTVLTGTWKNISGESVSGQKSIGGKTHYYSGLFVRTA